ncbi:PspC domain-containing protein [Candidatus Woesearchaeota archaeon]|nr:PspC domain-containing protein [Candidatus Woesearchaeota archaeon]
MLDVIHGFPNFGFPLFLLWAVLFGLLLFAFWVWALVDCAKSDLSDDDRLVWLLVIVFLHALGALIYVIVKPSVVEKSSRKKPRKKKAGRLSRSSEHKVLGGVCGGLAERWGMDPVAVRLLWVVASLVLQVFPGVLVYVVFWAALPEE